MIENVAIYGAGSWGTALALLLARNGLDVLLWDINAEHIKNIQENRENKDYLLGIPFPDNLNCTSDLAATMAHADFQLLVIPSHGFRPLLKNIKSLLHENHCLFWATKGVELDTGLLLHEVVEEELPNFQRYGLVSGPTFAAEVAKGLPTAITLACHDTTIADEIAHAFQGKTFRIYTSDDVIGVELGGSIKNVLAIAAGISDGLGYGANARAAIITRGLAEIMRLGEKLGAKSETLMGLAGVGDLVLTCTDNQSRNRRLGLALGEGKNRDDAIQEIGQAIEGFKSSRALRLLAEKAGVEMPICQQVYQILYEDLPPQQAVKALLSRDLKAEF
jgi:glycerol-3-phosphate dehydrogenase (NAD(P)+)